MLTSLKKLGAPPSLINWLVNILSNRIGILAFDRQETPVSIIAGVPQGSPLSLILFILFISSLYTALEPLQGKITIGFADDINILAFGPN